MVVTCSLPLQLRSCAAFDTGKSADHVESHVIICSCLMIMLGYMHTQYLEACIYCLPLRLHSIVNSYMLRDPGDYWHSVCHPYRPLGDIWDRFPYSFMSDVVSKYCIAWSMIVYSPRLLFHLGDPMKELWYLIFNDHMTQHHKSWEGRLDSLLSRELCLAGLAPSVLLVTAGKGLVAWHLRIHMYDDQLIIARTVWEKIHCS